MVIPNGIYPIPPNLIKYETYFNWLSHDRNVYFNLLNDKYNDFDHYINKEIP